MLGDAGVDVAVLAVDLGQQFSEVSGVHLRWLRSVPQLSPDMGPRDPIYDRRRFLLNDVHNLHFLHLNFLVVLILLHLRDTTQKSVRTLNRFTFKLKANITG